MGVGDKTGSWVGEGNAPCPPAGYGPATLMRQRQEPQLLCGRVEYCIVSAARSSAHLEDVKCVLFNPRGPLDFDALRAPDDSICIWCSGASRAVWCFRSGDEIE